MELEETVAVAELKERAERAEKQLAVERKYRMLRVIVDDDPDVISGSDVAQLLEDRVRVDSESGQLIGAREALLALKVAKPHLTWSGNPEARARVGRGSDVEAVQPETDLDRARKIFGPTSSGALAMKVKQNSPEEYARLRLVAVANHLVA